MKSVAINTILGQTIHTCLAERAKICNMPVVTCMALRDDILTGESYYIREAKCVKRILDYLSHTTALVLVATHDQELTKNERYKNYHFRSVMKDEDIVFDYRIYEGRCESSNAIALLSYLGYPKELVERAEAELSESFPEVLGTLPPGR